MKPNWCAEHSQPFPCLVCALDNASGPAAPVAVAAPVGQRYRAADFRRPRGITRPPPSPLVSFPVDDTNAEQIRDAMMGDPLWLAALLADLRDEECTCGGDC